MVQIDINNKPKQLTIENWLLSIDKTLIERGYSKDNQENVNEIVELLKYI
jgi:hypothetical protein